MFSSHGRSYFKVILQLEMIVYGHLATNEIATKLVASHADVLRGLSRVRGAGTRNEPLKTFAWEVTKLVDSSPTKSSEIIDTV